MNAYLATCRRSDATAEVPGNIYEIEVRVNTVAEMGRAIRELFFMP